MVITVNGILKIILEKLMINSTLPSSSPYLLTCLLTYSILQSPS